MVIDRFSQRWPNASLSVVDFPVTTIDRFADPRLPRFAQIGPSPTQADFRSKMPRPVLSFDVLRNCSNLRSVKATINADLGRGFEARRGLSNLMNVIFNCPNLKELHIAHCRIGTNVFLMAPWTLSNLKEGDKLPPVEELVVDPDIFPTFRSGFWNMSQLRRLRLIDVNTKSFLRTVRGRDLPRLEEFRLEERCIWEPEGLQEVLVMFLFDLPSLNVLSLSGVVGRIPMSVITMHGQSLRSLQLRETQHWMQTRSTRSTPGIRTSCPMLSLEDIGLLNALCPHLERLTLDVGRGADWVWISSSNILSLYANVSNSHGLFWRLLFSMETSAS